MKSKHVPTTLPRAYSYIRFSTPEQGKGDSLRRQVDAARTCAAALGLELDESLRDLGRSAYSGAHRTQGALGAFLRAVEAGEVPRGSLLIVESLDRLSREQVLDALEQFRAILKAGIEVVTLSDGQRYTEASVRRDFTQLLASLLVMARAHEESARKAERVRAAWGQKRLRAAGGEAMTARCVAWCRVAGTGRERRYELIPERAAVVRRIFQETVDGMGRRVVVRRLNAEAVPTWGRSGGWQDSYVAKMLQNRAVMGFGQPHHRTVEGRVPLGEEVAGYYPEAVPPDLFHRANAARVQRRGKGGPQGEGVANLFGGLARCGCGATMVQAFLAEDLTRFIKGGGTRDLMALAQRLVRHGFRNQGLDLGYRVLREHWDDSKAHLGYNGMFLLMREAPNSVPTPAVIVPGVAFTVRDENGRQQTYVIEDDGEPRVGLNEVAPGARLALSAIGRKVGDSIRVNDSSLLPEQQVVMLATKYVALFQRSINEFNTLFPDDPGLVGLTIDPEQLQRSLERMMPVLSGRRTALANMVECYRASNLPVALVARSLGLDPVDGWDAIRHAGEQLDVCLGVEAERRSAVELLKGRPSLVLDSMTFWIAGGLSLLDTLAGAFGPLGVAASTLDLLAEREHDALERLHSGGGFLVEHEGRLVMTEQSEAEKRALAEMASRLAGWARRHAVVLPAIPARDIDAEMRRLGDMAHPSVMDTVLAASGSGRVLLCEDRRLRDLAGSIAGPRSAWLEPALMACVLSCGITRTAYNDAMLDLALLGHRHMGLDGLTLLRATSRWGEQSAGMFGKVVARLSSPLVEYRSLLTVASTFLRHLWTQQRARSTKERFTAILLAACRQAHADSPDRTCAVLRGELKACRTRGASEDARQIAHAIRFIEQWCVANPFGNLSPGGPGAA